jgi:hypothetical protein
MDIKNWNCLSVIGLFDLAMKDRKFISLKDRVEHLERRINLAVFLMFIFRYDDC